MNPIGSAQNLTRQVEIIHLSDLHFGEEHAFAAPRTPSGDRASPKGIPTLEEKLLEDLQKEDPQCPVVVCMTGDFATTATRDEFDAAAKCVGVLASKPILGKKRGMKSFFAVPGNHDVQFDTDDYGKRWEQYTRFHNELFGQHISDTEPHALVQLHDRTAELGILILCLNSTMYVRRGSSDEHRGQVDPKQIKLVDDALKAIPNDELDSAVRIALIHHHPVLIPDLVEPDRGYDAVIRGGELLKVLRKYEFHAVLHGHKHVPHTFSEDTDSGFVSKTSRPIMVIAGGSVGSSSISSAPRSTNCYNRITVKWHPASGNTRIRVLTRGLTQFDENGERLLRNQWYWKTMKADDRSFVGGSDSDRKTPAFFGEREAWSDVHLRSGLEERRVDEYRRLRGNMPVVVVRPSLMSGQAYEAEFWIVEHTSTRAHQEGLIRELPVTVTWAAGSRFEVLTIASKDDPTFRGAYSYWGAMLIQGCLTFADSTREFAFIYARIPDGSA